MTRAWHKNFKRAPKEARTSRAGVEFHSKGELTRWEKLQLWQLAGAIRNLRRQVAFPLVYDDGDNTLIEVKTPTGQISKYTADFVYERQVDDAWVEVIEDYKGYSSNESKFRIAVFEALHGKKVTIS